LVASLASGVEIRVATFNIGANIEFGGGFVFFRDALGVPGSSDHESVKAVLDRMDADVVALQEVHSVDLSNGDVVDLATSLGYPYIYNPGGSNAFDPSLRVIFLSRFPFLSTDTIAPPVGSKDMTRLMPAVVVDVPGTNRDPLIIAAHLKSGSVPADRFQRAVEMRRLTNYLEAVGINSQDNFILMGDWNLVSSPTEFTNLPGSDLPATFDLGSDITFPINYFTDASAYFAEPAASLVQSRQLNGSTATFPSSGSTLDLFLVSPVISVRPSATEIYNSVLDVSNAEGLPKAGEPLDSEISAIASDHLAMFGDFELDAAVPYTFTNRGQIILEDFSGFTGKFDPYPWLTSGGGWLGQDDGSVSAPGFRSFGSEADPSLGFISGPDGGIATASFVNFTRYEIKDLDISFDAEQWRSALTGTIDRLSVEIIIDGQTRHLPELTFDSSNQLPSGALSPEVVTTLNARIRAIDISPGQAFELRFSYIKGAGGGPLPADVFINEFHYDNSGGDSGEFVEIVVGPGYAGSLSEVSLFLYNGNGGTTYSEHYSLDTFESTFATTSGHQIFSKEISGIQNGSPDGFALVAGGIVSQFISYEGAFLATNGAADGLFSTDIGVAQQPESSPGTSSLGLTGSGGNAADFAWTRFDGEPFTAGLANSGQFFTAPIQGQGFAIDNLSVTFLTDSDGDTFYDSDELILGTDPSDPNAYFEVTFTQSSGSTIELSHPTTPGRTYIVQESVDLQDWTNLTTYAGDGDERIEVITVDPEMPKRFFRIKVAITQP